MTAYETACHYFYSAARLMGLSKNMETLLLTPEREVKVQVALEMDNGEIGTFIGYSQPGCRIRADLDVLPGGSEDADCHGEQASGAKEGMSLEHIDSPHGFRVRHSSGRKARMVQIEEPGGLLCSLR